MSQLSNFVDTFRFQARVKRAQIFNLFFSLKPSSKLLDLGSGNGSHINSIIRHTPIKPEKVYIADINSNALESGRVKFGFNPILLSEDGKLPFIDNYFDIVFCSSVIEHVTVPKSRTWNVTGYEFRQFSFRRQKQFAQEIKRLGRNYFVQTPNKWSVIESHSWLPFIGLMPRSIQKPIIKCSNKIWIKKTIFDWNLLDAKDIYTLFPEAIIIREKWCGMTKSVIAIYNDPK